MQRVKSFLLVLFLGSILHANSIDSDLKIFTETYPPYNFKKDGKVTGFSTEILEAMFQQMHSAKTAKDIKLVPWARGYKVVAKKKNTMLYSTFRIPERENLFKWVGPIKRVSRDIISLKEKQVSIHTIDDIKKYSLGGVLGWSAIDTLVAQGVEKKSIQLFSGKYAAKKGFEKLILNDLDLFIYNLDAIDYDPTLKKFASKEFKIVYRISAKDLYFAFNKDTDPKIIQAYQNALDTIKKNGTYNKILKKYWP